MSYYYVYTGISALYFKPMTLDVVELNTPYKVTGFTENCPKEIISNFQKLGIFPGITVKVSNNSYHPLQILIDMSLYHCRREEARYVEVEIL